MAIVADYIGSAVARSIRNKGQQLAGDTELLNAFNRILAGLFALGARINPSYYGANAVVASQLDGLLVRWPWPTDANLIYYLEYNDPAEEVAVVPYDDLQAEPIMPAVYQRKGAYYYAAGNATDPSGDLTFWYSRQPAVAVSVASSVDASWPVAYDDLLISELALYLSMKDNRGDELIAIREERDRWFAIYANYLEQISGIERRRKPSIRVFNSPGMIPMGTLLTGGGG